MNRLGDFRLPIADCQLVCNVIRMITLSLSRASRKDNLLIGNRQSAIGNDKCEAKLVNTAV